MSTVIHKPFLKKIAFHASRPHLCFHSIYSWFILRKTIATMFLEFVAWHILHSDVPGLAWPESQWLGPGFRGSGLEKTQARQAFRVGLAWAWSGLGQASGSKIENSVKVNIIISHQSDTLSDKSKLHSHD